MIKFRGLRKTGSGFVFGSIVIDNKGKCFIASNNVYKNNIDVNVVNLYEIQSDSIGQFTGLFDEFGNEIYVGDLLRPISKDYTYEVVFQNGVFGLKSELGFWGSLDKFINVCRDHGWSYSIDGNVLSKI